MTLQLTRLQLVNQSVPNVYRPIQGGPRLDFSTIGNEALRLRTIQAIDTGYAVAAQRESGVLFETIQGMHRRNRDVIIYTDDREVMRSSRRDGATRYTDELFNNDGLTELRGNIVWLNPENLGGSADLMGRIANIVWHETAHLTGANHSNILDEHRYYSDREWNNRMAEMRGEMLGASSDGKIHDPVLNIRARHRDRWVARDEDNRVHLRYSPDSDRI
jgi:hypothetical protein